MITTWVPGQKLLGLDHTKVNVEFAFCREDKTASEKRAYTDRGLSCQCIHKFKHGCKARFCNQIFICCMQKFKGV